MEREIQLPKDLEMFGCLFPEYTAMEIDLIISVIETVVNKLGPPQIPLESQVISPYKSWNF